MIPPPLEHLILVDLLPSIAYWRGVISGVARFCTEHPHVRFRQPVSDWELTMDPIVVDGVITGPPVDEASPTARRPEPVVSIAPMRWPAFDAEVSTDNFAVGAMAAEHLLDQGYAHFACHVRSGTGFSEQRRDGFVARLREAGADCAIFDSAVGSQRAATSGESIRDQARAELLRVPKPVGVMAHNDIRASMLIEICHEAGLRVPEEVGIIGCDNDEFFTGTVRPGLTSIDPSAELVGYRAAELLVAMIEGATPPDQSVRVAPRGVVIRESTMPVRVDDDVVGRALSYIRDHATKPVSVEEVVNAIATSRRSLERRFREHLRRTPAAEIRRVQMEHAKQLLIRSDRTLAWIARASGYRSLRNFATAFKREVGQAPTAFRQQFRSR